MSDRAPTSERKCARPCQLRLPICQGLSHAHIVIVDLANCLGMQICSRSLLGAPCIEGTKAMPSEHPHDQFPVLALSVCEALIKKTRSYQLVLPS